MKLQWIGQPGLYPIEGFEMHWVQPGAEFEVGEGRARELIEAGAAKAVVGAAKAVVGAAKAVVGAAKATVIGAAYEEDE